MFSKLALFCALFGLSGINSQTTTDCNYEEIGEIFFLFFGLFPGHYAEGYCISQYFGTEEGGAMFVCDGDDGYYESFENDDCEGDPSNVTEASSSSTWVCGSSDTCDVYTLDYDSYVLGYECDGTQLIGTQYSLLDDGACIPITVFGFEFAYGVVTLTDSSYTLTLYNESTTCSSGFSTELVFEEGCYGNETSDTSTNFDVSAGGSSGGSSSAAQSQFNGVFAIAFVTIAAFIASLLQQ